MDDGHPLRSTHSRDREAPTGITDVRVLSRYFVELIADAEARVIDLEPFLNDLHFRELLDSYQVFEEVELDSAGLRLGWPNGAYLALAPIWRRAKPSQP